MSGGVVSGREALAEALSERFGWPTENEWEEQPEEVREDWRADADALLASGAVREEAAVRAEALREAADEIRTSVSSGFGMRPDGSEDPLASAYVEGLRDAYQIVTDRAAALAPQDPA